MMGEPEQPAAKEKDTSSSSFWRTLRDNLWPSREAYLQRIDDLDAAIARDPEALANYVVRGETYLALHFDAFAAIDFEHALETASQAVETNKWGIVAQAVQDRALRGLEIAEARLRKKRQSS